MGQTSDRVFKSNEPWAKPYFEEARDNLRVNPSYLEVSFDSTCNLKCAYCGPTLSSKWQEEIEEHGAYENGHQNPHLLKRIGRWPQLNREHNPYKEAFWEWWPDLYPDLRVFRITGGEPLLSKDTWRVLDWIAENPHLNLTVSINTNLSVPDNLIRKLVEYERKLASNVQQFQIFTSAEAWGAQCEYIRYPMNFEKFWKNFYYLTSQVPHVTMISTVNLLALESLPALIEEGLSWGSKFIPYSPSWSLPMLQEPSFLDPRLAPEAVKYTFTERMADVMEVARAYNHEPFNRLQSEIDRCVAYVNDTHPKREINIESFKKYIREYDRRRQLNFAETFPHMNQYIKVYE
jgi:organic radical activating enzyme